MEYLSEFIGSHRVFNYFVGMLGDDKVYYRQLTPCKYEVLSVDDVNSRIISPYIVTSCSAGCPFEELDEHGLKLKVSYDIRIMGIE